MSIWGSYSQFLIRRAWALTVVSICLVVALGAVVRNLQIQSDFKKMLPQEYRSVIELRRIESRVKSTSTLHLLVGGEDWPAMRRFIDDFVDRIPDALGDIIAHVEYNNHASRDFYQKNKYLYVDLEDLQEVHHRLKRQMDYEKFRKSPIYVEMGDPPTFDIGDIEDKYRSKTSQHEHYRDGYFTSADGTLAIVVLKPKSGATDIAFAKHLMARVDAVIDDLQPSSYHPSLKTGFGGRYQKLTTELSTIVGDLLRTIFLCITLIGGIVYCYFRSFRILFFMIGAAGCGTLIALATAHLVIGYLTIQTAFLGTIILGNGINYSLILYARLLEERRRHAADFGHVLQTTLNATWRPTLASAVTTAAAFSALALTAVRGLSQFALIGSVGILSAWLVTFALLPAWIVVGERLRPMSPKIFERTPLFVPLLRRIPQLIVRHGRTVLRVTAVVSAAAVISVALFLPNALEYNFNNLRFRPAQAEKVWEATARDSADDIFHRSASPVVVMTDTREQSRLVCAAVEARGRNIRNAAGDPIFDRCKSMYSHLPADQDAKFTILATLRELVENHTFSTLTEAQLERIDEVLATQDLTPVTLDDLPQAIREIYQEADGREGLVTFIYPTRVANLWDGRELVKFANLFRAIPLSNGDIIYASGEPAIYADLLQAVTTEGPRAMLFSFGLVLFMVWIGFRRRLAAALTIMGALVIGILWMIALFPVVGVRLNFLNFVALPIAFGIGVDYAVNVYTRYRESSGDLVATTNHLGGAVLLCSLTTMFGYSVLMISRNRALASLGTAALLAEITCITVALIVLPTYLRRCDASRVDHDNPLAAPIGSDRHQA
jgi:uncharacterized protein